MNKERVLAKTNYSFEKRQKELAKKKKKEKKKHDGQGCNTEKMNYFIAKIPHSAGSFFYRSVFYAEHEA